MLADKLSIHSEILSNILTPPDSIVKYEQIPNSTFYSTDILIKNIIKEYNFSQEIIEKIQYCLSTKQFNNAICFGKPKKNSQNSEEQFVYLSSLLYQLLNEIEILIVIVSKFTIFFQNITIDTIQGKKTIDFFGKSFKDLYNITCTINKIARIIDVNLEQIRNECGMPAISKPINGFTIRVFGFINNSNQFRVLAENNRPTENINETIINNVEEIDFLARRFHNMFNLLKGKIKENFKPLFDKKQYIEWQEYCAKVSDMISEFAFIAFMIARYSHEHFVTILSSVQTLLNETFSMMSPYLLTLGFRGNFDDYKTKSKDAKEKMLPVLNQLISNMTKGITECPVPFIIFSKERIQVLAKEIQNVCNEYDKNVETLIAAIKEDPLFPNLNLPKIADNLEIKEIFAENDEKEIKDDKKVPDDESGLFIDTQKTIDELFPIIQHLLCKNELSLAFVMSKYNVFSDAFNKFEKSFDEYINNISDDKEKTRYEIINIAISYNMAQFTLVIYDFFKKNQKDNRNRIGVLSSLLYLALSCGNNNAGLNSFNEFRSVLANFFIHHFENNELLDTLIQVSFMFCQKYTEKKKNLLTYLCSYYNQISEDSIKIFNSCKDLNNIKFIGNCMRKCDELQIILIAIFSQIEKDEENEYVEAVMRFLTFESFIIQSSVESYRLSVQIQITKLLTEYVSILRSVVESIVKESKNYDDGIRKKISDLQIKINDSIEKLEKEFDNHPLLLLSFDIKYCKKVKSLYENMQIPTYDMISCSKKIVSSSSNASKLTEMFLSLTTIGTSLNSIIPFIEEIHSSASYRNPSIIGPIHSVLIENASESIKVLDDIMYLNQKDATYNCMKFVETINNVVNLLSNVDESDEIVEELQQNLKSFILLSCHIINGKIQEIPKFSSLIPKIVFVIIKATPIFKKLYNTLVENANQLCNDEKDKSQNTNKTEQKDLIQNDNNEEDKKGLISILDEKVMHEFKTIEEIGSGGGGRVLKVSRNNIIYALKIMNLTKCSDDNMSSFRHFINEYEIMNMLDHPNILKTFGIFLSDEKTSPSILLEFCPNNLEDAMTKNTITKVQIVCIVYQIVEGMKYVHFQKIIHRDLKPSNILITKNGIVKICDFGIAKIMSTEQQLTTCGLGTQKYMAPEIINEDEYNEKADVYSFGVLVFAILNGGNLPVIKMRDICTGKKAQIPDTFTEFARNLINSCWNFEPNDRPSFDMILESFENQKYNLIDVNDEEKQEIETFIQKYKTQIPKY